MRNKRRFALAAIVAAICVTSTVAHADDNVTINSPSTTTKQSFQSGDQIVFMGTCTTTPYNVVATLPWRTPTGVPLYPTTGGNGWSSVQTDNNHSIITAPTVTTATDYTMAVECFNNKGESLGTASVAMVIPKP
jgi:hypothetical protein